MKRVERTIEITENVKEVIIKYKDNTEKVINNEEVIYVPKCIGLDSEKTLLFNNNKSLIYANGGLYNVYTFQNPRTNQNNGKNFKLVKCNFDEVEVGSIITTTESSGSIKLLYNYEIKINEEEAIWIEEDLYVGVSERQGQIVYKVVSI